MMKNIQIKYIGNKTQVMVGRRNSSYTIKTYDLNRLTQSSVRRLNRVMANNWINKTVELDEADLNPTIYFSFGQAKIETMSAGKSLLYPEKE